MAETKSHPGASDKRLESWKEIAAYLQRNVATVQRWEKNEGLPIHRHSHNSRSSVYAYPSEIDAWRVSRKVVADAMPPAPVNTFWRVPTFALAILLCLIMAGNGVRPQAASAKDGPIAKRLVCSDCSYGDGRLSTDGRWMVFPDWSTGDLAIRDISSGKDRRLMVKAGGYEASDAEVHAAILSPDRRQILYYWWTGNGDDRFQLRLMPNEPGAKSRVLVEGSQYWPLDWFPDGKSALISLGRPDRTSQLASISISDGAVKVLKPLEWRLAMTGLDPRLSPDGRYIVYAARAVNPSKYPPAPSDPRDVHIYLMTSDGSRETEIVKTAGRNNNPIWTPDGRHILFTSDRSGRPDLWSIAVQDGKAAGEASLVSAEIGDVWPIGMAGGSLYYTHTQQGDYVHIVEAATGGGTHETDMFNGFWPAWSLDGKLVAFQRHHPGGAADDYDLVIHALETGEERMPLAGFGTTSLAPPIWFHDSASIMTGVRHNGQPAALYRIDLKTGSIKEMPAGGIGPLAPDDKTLYVVQPGDGKPPVRLVAFDLSTGQERVLLASLPERAPMVTGPSIDLSPDGKTLALGWVDPIAGENRRVHIATISVDGSGFREVFRDDKLPLAPLALKWGRDGRSILMKQSNTDGAGGRGVIRIPAGGGSPALAFPARPVLRGFDVGPDGSHYAYSTNEFVEELWALDNLLPVLK